MVTIFKIVSTRQVPGLALPRRKFPWSIVILSCILHRLQIRGYADDAEGNPGLWRENGTAPGIPPIGRQGSGHHTQSAGAET
ncbi:unnamed protein product [Nesidiocoris tenuis]|uniref:Uncharacterized protein n=1 Tax=Nesidiocoris tenuis TaxID=355587 RepID=A0A6H5GMT3_9HEMI|nr:unnamed protein product [Nesidiocoris tenuis]